MKDEHAKQTEDTPAEKDQAQPAQAEAPAEDLSDEDLDQAAGGFVTAEIT